MSKTVKICLVLGSLGVVSLLVCCGGRYFSARNATRFTHDPVQVVADTAKIAEITIPETYKPEATVGMNVGLRMQMVVYRKNDGELALVEIVFPRKLSPEEMKESFEFQSKQQTEGRDLKIEAVKKRTFVIDGEPRDFEFMVGTDNKTRQTVHLVNGLFPGREGMAFLTLTADEPDWDEAETVKIIESISTK